MIPGIIGIGGVVTTPQTIQYSRTTYNAGNVTSGTMTIDIATQMPYVRSGDLMQIDALWWAGSWCDLWKDRVSFYFKYGTTYNSGVINGNLSGKNHVIYFEYAGGTSATVGHYYTGGSTSFPNAEVSIDRLVWLGTTTGSFNYYVQSQPA